MKEKSLIFYHQEKKLHVCKPIPKRQILDSSKLKEFADDNFKFDKNFTKFSRRVENTVGKGEIARKNQGLFGKGLTHSLIHYFETV